MRQDMHDSGASTPRSKGSAASPPAQASRARSATPPDDGAADAEISMSGAPHDGSPEGTLSHSHRTSMAPPGHVVFDSAHYSRSTYMPPPAGVQPAAPPARRAERPWSAFDSRGALDLHALHAALPPQPAPHDSGARTSPLPPPAQHDGFALSSARGGWRSAPASSSQTSMMRHMLRMEQFAPGGFPPALAGARRSLPGYTQLSDARAVLAAALSPATSGVTSATTASASRFGTDTSSRSAALDFAAGGASPPLLTPPDVPQPFSRAGSPFDMQPRAMSMRTLKLLLDSCDNSPASVRAALLHTTPDFAPGLPGLTKLISKFSKEGAWRKALAVFRSVSALGLRADTTIMNAAIAACGVAQDAAAARRIFDAMPAHGVLPDTITYKAMVMAFTSCREWRECVEMFLHSRRSGVLMDAVTCMVVVTTVSRAGHWQIAEDVFRLSFSQSVSFRALDDLAACPPPPGGSPDDGAALHAQVRQLGRTAAARHLGARALEQRGVVVAARGIEGDPMARATCNAMLAAYGDAQQGSRGLALLMTMMRSGPNLAPDIVSFNAVIGVFASGGDLGRALSVLDAITVAPTIHTFRPLMTAALAAGQRDLVLDLWARALRSRVLPDTEALNLCLQALVVPGDQGSLWLDALRVLSVALKEDLTPLEQPGGGAGARYAPPPPVGPALFTPGEPLAQRVDIAEQLAHYLQGAGVAVDVATMRIVMDAALLHGAPAAALRVFHCLVRHSVVPDVTCVNLHLRALARLGEWLPAYHALCNALRGVGVDLESFAIMTRLLADVAFVAAQHGPELLPLVHQIMDEIHLLQRLLEQDAAVARAVASGASAAMPQESAVLGSAAPAASPADPQ